MYHTQTLCEMYHLKQVHKSVSPGFQHGKLTNYLYNIQHAQEGRNNNNTHTNLVSARCNLHVFRATHSMYQCSKSHPFWTVPFDFTEPVPVTVPISFWHSIKMYAKGVVPISAKTKTQLLLSNYKYVKVRLKIVAKSFRQCFILKEEYSGLQGYQVCMKFKVLTFFCPELGC